jgi:hypothetical protein
MQHISDFHDVDRIQYKRSSCSINSLWRVHDNRPCSTSTWALEFTATIGNEVIYSDVLPTNLINAQSLISILPPGVQSPYNIISADVDIDSILDARSGFTLSFSRTPAGPTLAAIVNAVKIIFQGGKVVYVIN